MLQRRDTVQCPVDGAAELDADVPPRKSHKSQNGRCMQRAGWTNLKVSSDLAFLRVISSKVFMNLPQLALYR